MDAHGAGRFKPGGARHATCLQAGSLAAKCGFFGERRGALVACRRTVAAHRPNCILAALAGLLAGGGCAASVRDAKTPEAPEAAEAGRVAQLAQRQRQLEDRIRRLEDRLHLLEAGGGAISLADPPPTPAPAPRDPAGRRRAPAAKAARDGDGIGLFRTPVTLSAPRPAAPAQSFEPMAPPAGGTGEPVAPPAGGGGAPDPDAGGGGAPDPDAAAPGATADAGASRRRFRIEGRKLVELTRVPPKVTQAPAKRGAGPAPGRSRRSKSKDPVVRAYQAAMEDLRAGRHAEARRAFDRIARRHPRHPYADNALYWKGEAAYDAGDYEAALSDFTAVVERYAGGNKAPDALLKIALCYQRLGRVEEATALLTELIEAYPRARASDVARLKLVEIRG